MNPVYTRQQLQSYKRPQLWDICRTNGIPCYPKSADCVEAILSKQLESLEKVANAEVKANIEPTTIVKTCATCPLFKPFNDGTGRGLCCGVADTSLVVREHHTLTQDCQNVIDEQAAAQIELNEYVAVQSEAVAPEIEIDSDQDNDFGLLYRVWSASQLLGTFYRAFDGKWVVQPCNSSDRPRVKTPKEAQLLIVALSGLLVVDTHNDNDDTEIDELLDKPFDELTPDDWKRLKQLENLEPIVA